MAPVSGVVTIDGEPVSGVRVIYWPEPVEGNNSPGPYSSGTTDANGRYELEGRRGGKGAMVWKHKISFEYDDVDDEAADSARMAKIESKQTGGAISQEEKDLTSQAKNQMKGKVRIPQRYLDGGRDQFIITIEAGGTDKADLALTSNK